MFFIPSTSVVSGAEKPQGTNTPLKRGIWVKIVLPCLHHYHSSITLLNNSTLSLGDNTGRSLQNFTLVSFFRGYKPHHCNSASFPDRVQKWDCSRNRTQMVPWDQEKWGNWCKSQRPHVTLAEGGRSCPHRTIEGNAVADLAAVCAFKTSSWGWKSLATEKQNTSGDKGFHSCI